MWHKSPIFAVWSLSLVVISFGGQSAHAGMITSLNVNVMPIDQGLFKYDYFLNNESSSTASVLLLEVDLSSEANLQSIVNPVGWDNDYAPGNTVLSWFSTDATFNLQPGGSLSFTFLSPLNATPLPFSVLGLDNVTFDVDSNDGTILSAGVSPSTPVPESSSFSLMVCGFLGLMAGAWRCRNVRSTSRRVG